MNEHPCNWGLVIERAPSRGCQEPFITTSLHGINLFPQQMVREFVHWIHRASTTLNTKVEMDAPTTSTPAREGCIAVADWRRAAWPPQRAQRSVLFSAIWSTSLHQYPVKIVLTNCNHTDQLKCTNGCKHPWKKQQHWLNLIHKLSTSDERYVHAFPHSHSAHQHDLSSQAKAEPSANGGTLVFNLCTYRKRRESHF